jgi:hypothetical protein
MAPLIQLLFVEVQGGFMKTSALVPASLLVLLTSGGFSVASADTNYSTCEVRKDGDNKKNASGPCTFSQRQGYVDIDLRNGDTYSLRPMDKPNHFKDQKGNTVVRTTSGGGTHEYKWEHKRIIVTFGGGSSYNSGNSKDHQYSKDNQYSGGGAGEMQYLAGSRYVGGEVDDQLLNHGYQKVTDRVDGKSVHSYWRKRSSGDCVVVHFVDSHVKNVSAGQGNCKP